MNGKVFGWHLHGLRVIEDLETLGDHEHGEPVDATVTAVTDGVVVSCVRQGHRTIHLALENESAAEFARTVDATGHGWIPVGDSMPVSNVSVLLCTDHPSGGMCDGWWCSRTGWSHTGVTHWRPLPSRPV